VTNFIACQLATVASTVPFGENWIFEPKFDGYRCRLLIEGTSRRLLTRNGQDWTERLGSVLPEPTATTIGSCDVDGEICVLDANGRPDFSRLGRELAEGNPSLTYFAYDLLSVDGESLMSLPLLARKQRLRAVASALGCKNIQFVEHTSDGRRLCNEMRLAGWEGVMGKDINALYLPGVRSPGWRKLKFTRRQEFAIAGWRPDPAGAVKSIVLGTFDGAEVTTHGSVGSGFASSARSDLATLFSRHSAPRSSGSARDKHIRWLNPVLVAEIEFQDFSVSGQVRGASYLGLREDKMAADVRLEHTNYALR
jgi:bifunctional non-homologous end joining protein LigD